MISGLGLNGSTPGRGPMNAAAGLNPGGKIMFGFWGFGSRVQGLRFRV